MPRLAREKSNSGIYHIMVRGINRQDIFHDEADRAAYLGRLLRYQPEHDCQIHAYALMDNHIHVLMGEGGEDISVTMKKIGISYVSYYNAKYERCGHLFQDRFRSEKVEDDAHFLTVSRYIHQNPVKIGRMIDYWTSYPEYVKPRGIINTDFTLAMFDGRSAALLEFLAMDNDDMCMDIDSIGHRSNDEAKKIADSLLDGKDIRAIQALDRKNRNRILHTMKQRGLTIRQIGELTGLSKGVIQRV